MRTMTEHDIGRFAYLALLLLAVAGWVIAEHRRNLGAILRQGLGWGFIFLAAIAAYGLWGEIRTQVAPRQAVFDGGARIEVPRAPDGHYFVTLAVGGTPVRFMVDTGATSTALAGRDADRLRIDRTQLAFTGQARTANGMIRTARVTLRDVTLDGVPQGNVAAWVGDGPLDVSLLGMDFLGRFSRIEIAGDRLILTR
jgi:aspartyl protease family protein